MNEAFLQTSTDTTLLFMTKQSRPHTRKRFTVAHELGHIVLGHVRHDSVACRDGVTLWNMGNQTEPAPEETAANIFASRLLAPACVLHALDIHTAGEIASVCGLSNMAAEARTKRMAGAVRARTGVAVYKRVFLLWRVAAGAARAGAVWGFYKGV